MSWQVNGIGPYFHNYAAYQRALEATQHNSARAQVRREASRLRDTLSGINPELARARGNVARQQELSHDLANHVADAGESLRRFNAGFATELAQLERDRDHLRQSADRLQHNVQEIEADLDKHIEKIKAEFAAAKEELEGVMGQLQTQRQELESRVRSEKHALETRLEKDRADRLAKAANETEKANVLLNEADTTAQAVEAGARQIHHAALVARIESLRGNIARGRALGAAAGLAQATQLGIEARVASSEYEQAALGMQADRRRVVGLGERIDGTLKQPLVEKLYPAQHRVLCRDLAAILAPVEEMYADHEVYAVERPRHLRELEDILRRAEQCASNAPMDEARRLERDRTAEARLARELDECHEPAEIVKEELLDKDDPLSDLLVTVKSPSEEKLFRFEISGRVAISSYGHRDNATCQASLARAQKALADDTRITYQAQDHTTLGAAPPPSPSPEPIRTRQDMDRRDQA